MQSKHEILKEELKKDKAMRRCVRYALQSNKAQIGTDDKLPVQTYFVFRFRGDSCADNKLFHKIETM